MKMQPYLAVFDALKSERGPEFATQHGLTVKSGEALGAAMLKILKPQWTTDNSDGILNSNGLFLGIWIDGECEAKGMVRYSLHAKKLREIMGEAFAAREFVRSFRVQCQGELEGWPNWTYPKGPITLFQGHFTLNSATLHEETSQLMDKFAKLAPHLERLLS